jgi:hypothetical protein
MTGAPETVGTEADHERAVWFLHLVAKRLRTRPDGTAVVALPANYVDALQQLAGTPAGRALTTDRHNQPAPGLTTYIAMCGARTCPNNGDVWETGINGSPCPTCGNTEGNVYDSLDELLAESDGLFGPYVYRYTRAQALADGELVDVTTVAAEAGFCHPVALTAAVWRLAVEWPASEPEIQDEQGRLWDVVYMAADAARRQAGREQLFGLAVVPRGRMAPESVQLKCVCGPGDDGEPVITIMCPEES